MSDLMNDLAFGWRMLRRTPGGTLLVIATLALGIEGNRSRFWRERRPSGERRSISTARPGLSG